MNKFPNAPAEHHKPKKKHVRLSLEEFEEINRLWTSTEMNQMEIALKIGRSASCVNAAIRQGQEGKAFVKKRTLSDRMKDKVVYNELEEVDFSKFPDNVLFKHMRASLI